MIGVTLRGFWGRPDDIWTGYTLRDLMKETKAFRLKLERDQDLVMSHAATLANCWVKKKITLEDLTGRRSTRPSGNFAENSETGGGGTYREQFDKRLEAKHGEWSDALTKVGDEEYAPFDNPETYEELSRSLKALCPIDDDAKVSDGGK